MDSISLLLKCHTYFLQRKVLVYVPALAKTVISSPSHKKIPIVCHTMDNGKSCFPSTKLLRRNDFDPFQATVQDQGVLLFQCGEKDPLALDPRLASATRIQAFHRAGGLQWTFHFFRDFPRKLENHDSRKENAV